MVQLNDGTICWVQGRSIAQQKKAEPTFPPNQHHQNVALIVGVTGIAGSGLAETLSTISDTPWKVYGVARRAFPKWLAKLNTQYIQCDILSTEQCLSKLSPLTDTTHIFYVSWTGSEDCAQNTIMFQNILDSVIPNAPNLKHVSLQTGVKHYWGNMVDEIDTTNNVSHDFPFYENTPRLKQPNFYYNLEDSLFEAVSRRKENNLTWSIHRPSLIFGFSPCSLMNIVSTLCVYASICKHENKPLVYTGTKTSWNCMVDAVDSGLLADQLIWAATDPKGKNQAFNCNNGDVFRWTHIWKVLAEQFELEAVGYEEGNESVLLEDLMKHKGPVWDEIVQKNSLVKTKLEEIAAFWFADIAFSVDGVLASMNKSKEFGFLGFRDSTKSFVSCVAKVRAYGFIP